MVDEIVALSMDKWDNAASIFYSQAISVIKLWNKGMTKLSKLP